MKALIKHLIQNHFDEVVEKSIMNCHTHGLHSLMLLEHPEKTIRLFIATENNEMWRNSEKVFRKGEESMSIAFHPHHCNLTIECVQGVLTNWIVRERQGVCNLAYDDDLIVTKYLYKSKILAGEQRFETLNEVRLIDSSRKKLTKGDSVFMTAKDIHTVSCLPFETSAWLVYEGKENAKYDSICYSNDKNLNSVDTKGLYLKPTKRDIEILLEELGIYLNK